MRRYRQQHPQEQQRSGGEDVAVDVSCVVELAAVGSDSAGTSIGAGAGGGSGGGGGGAVFSVRATALTGGLEDSLRCLGQVRGRLSWRTAWATS